MNAVLYPLRLLFQYHFNLFVFWPHIDVFLNSYLVKQHSMAQSLDKENIINLVLILETKI